MKAALLFPKLSLLLVGLTLSISSLGMPLYAQPQAVTFQQVLQYLELEVKEEKILKILESSPAVFTLSQEQIRKLKDAGATDRIIDAMKKSGAKVSEGSSDIFDFVLILDCSGSMREEVEKGTTKFKAAQNAAVSLVRSIPDKRQLALIVYGHDLTKRCAAVETIRPLSELDDGGKEDVAAMIAELKPSGDTPIAASLASATAMLQGTKSLAKVIVITDGMESCKGDPAEEAGKLAKLAHVRGGVDVIGFGLKKEEIAAVEKIARAGRGEFYNADTVAQLRESVEKVGERIAKSKLNDSDETGISALDRILIKNLTDKDVNVRGKAAKTLGERKLKAAAPALATLVSSEAWDYGHSSNGIAKNSDSDGSKDLALTSLLVIDREAAEKALIAGLTSKHHKVAAWSAHKIGENKMKGAMPELAKVLASDRWDPAISILPMFGYNTHLLDAQKVIALAVLKKVDRPAAEESLLKAAESKNEKLRAWATDMLTKLADEAK